VGLALKSFFTPSPLKQQAHALYLAAVAQARQPFLYAGYQVPDTLDGRFDAIILHVFLLMQRLKSEPDARAHTLAQLLAETFFTDMDRSLREMGVTDTGVGKRIKKMASAYMGRIKAYEEAKSEEALAEALAHNLYRAASANENARMLSQYAHVCMKALTRQTLPEIVTGEVRFVS
jgi:cytochrome b pre-mRNA-processing protein 3